MLTPICFLGHYLFNFFLSHTTMKLLSILLIIMFFVACQKPFEERIVDELKQWTDTNCPKNLDAITRLDSMTYHKPTKTVQYWYTAAGEADNAFYWQQVEANKLVVKQNLAQQLRVNTEIKELVAKHLNFEYIYRSAETGRRLYALTVTSSDYE